MKNFVVGKYVDYEEYAVLACFDSAKKAKDYIDKHIGDVYEVYVMREDDVLGKFTSEDLNKYTEEYYNLANTLLNVFNKYLDTNPTYKFNKAEYETYMKCKEDVEKYNILYQEDT